MYFKEKSRPIEQREIGGFLDHGTLIGIPEMSLCIVVMTAYVDIPTTSHHTIDTIIC